jgi:hypothetical protein
MQFSSESLVKFGWSRCFSTSRTACQKVGILPTMGSIGHSRAFYASSLGTESVFIYRYSELVRHRSVTQQLGEVKTECSGIHGKGRWRVGQTWQGHMLVKERLRSCSKTRMGRSLAAASALRD